MISIRYPTAPDAVDASGLFQGISSFGDNLKARKAWEKYDEWLRGSQPDQTQTASVAPQVQTQPLDYASQRVAQAHDASGGNPPAGAIESYIRHAAQKRGIDPDIAVRVAQSEGGLNDPVRQSDVVKDGVREQSYGPFQLYMGGGLGNEFQQATGLHPGDASAWQKGIDFALDKAKENGWGAWYGAAKAGIGERDGIGGAQGAVNALAGTQPQQVAQSAPAATGGASLPPADVMRALFRSEQTRPLAIELAKSAQAARQGDPEAALRLEKLRLEVENMRNPQAKPNIINAGDGQLYDANSGQWIQAPGQQGQPQGFRFSGKSVEAQALNGLIDSGQITVEQAQQLGAGKTITGPNGEIIFLTPQGVFSQPQGGNAQPVEGGSSGNIQITEPKVTVDEKKAMTFADRMGTSGKIIDDLEDAGTSYSDSLKSAVPGIGNSLVSKDYQKLDQARRDFVNAQLRRESGAVISDEEFNNANRQYFPQPGDSKEVIEQKRRNRQIAIDGMKRDAGPTYKAPSGNRVVIDGYTIEEVD